MESCKRLEKSLSIYSSLISYLKIGTRVYYIFMSENTKRLKLRTLFTVKTIIILNTEHNAVKQCSNRKNNNTEMYPLKHKRSVEKTLHPYIDI